VVIITCPLFYKDRSDIYAGHKALYVWIPLILFTGVVIKLTSGFMESELDVCTYIH
jgi:hypothetical protein